MPGYDDLLMLDTQAERLGVLWRNQGQAFLDEQAAELQDDVDRLREAYAAQVPADASPAEPAPGRSLRKLLPVRVPKPMAMPMPEDAQVIDLREPRDSGVQPGWVCSKDGHFLESAIARCSRCHDIFCERCILQNESTQGRPVCLECALVLAGVHHKRIRPLRVLH